MLENLAKPRSECFIIVFGEVVPDPSHVDFLFNSHFVKSLSDSWHCHQFVYLEQLFLVVLAMSILAPGLVVELWRLGHHCFSSLHVCQ